MLRSRIAGVFFYIVCLLLQNKLSENSTLDFKQFFVCPLFLAQVTKGLPCQGNRIATIKPTNNMETNQSLEESSSFFSDSTCTYHLDPRQLNTLQVIPFVPLDLYQEHRSERHLK